MTANSGYDANTGEQMEEDADRELPGTVTLLVTPEQSTVLAELEADGKLYVSLVYRGTSENAARFIEAQDRVLRELYDPEKSEGETAEENAEESAVEGNLMEEGVEPENSEIGESEVE